MFILARFLENFSSFLFKYCFYDIPLGTLEMSKFGEYWLVTNPVPLSS